MTRLNRYTNEVPTNQNAAKCARLAELHPGVTESINGLLAACFEPAVMVADCMKAAPAFRQIEDGNSKAGEPLSECAVFVCPVLSGSGMRVLEHFSPRGNALHNAFPVWNRLGTEPAVATDTCENAIANNDDSIRS